MNLPTMEAMEGWAGLEAPGAANVFHKPEDDVFYAETCQLFSTDLGQRWLEKVRERFEGAPVMPTHSRDGIETALFMAFRDGENNFYRHIKGWIKKGAELNAGS